MQRLSTDSSLRRSVAIACVMLAVVLLAWGFLQPIAPARAARALVDATATPTATNTPTPTAIATNFPIVNGGGFAQFLNCGAYGLTLTASGDCVQTHNGSQIHMYGAAGGNTVSINGETGDITTTGNITLTGGLSAGTFTLAGTPYATPTPDNRILRYGATGTPVNQKLVCGETNITGTGAIVTGLATPQYVQMSMAADANGDHARVTFTNSAATVTAKVWNSALTPAAATTTVPIDWCVAGTP